MNFLIYKAILKRPPLEIIPAEYFKVPSQLYHLDYVKIPGSHTVKHGSMEVAKAPVITYLFIKSIPDTITKGPQVEVPMNPAAYSALQNLIQ